MYQTAFFDAKPYVQGLFEKYGGSRGISFNYYDTKLCENTAGLASGCDAVCVFVNDNINDKVIDRLCEAGVRLIALRCAGFNNVDMKYAKDKIKVVRVPAYSPFAVAEHAMAMLLTSVRHIHKAYNRTRDYNFSLDGLVGFDLHGKTVGVIGTGKIGRIFINICRGFGMDVIATDPYPNENSDINYVSPDELFQKSDIISLHCPLTDDTRHIINESSISKMKKDAIIINTSRGALIDTDALIDGIKERIISAACLDVYEEESEVFFEDKSSDIVEDDNLARLLILPNVIITSHQAFLTSEALKNIADVTTQNIIDFFENKPLKNEVIIE